MLLSYQDIENIEKKGYEKKYFVREHEGWFQLKNANGRCIFHNGDKCTIYEDRPAGCRLYPVVYEKNSRSAILDNECPLRHCFIPTKPKEEQLFKLVSVLESERGQRHKKNNITSSK
jgi:hypothetical protein